MNFEFSRQNFEKYSDIKFHENPSIGSRVDRKLNAIFLWQLEEIRTMQGLLLSIFGAVT
jgi:hypothetical protein